MSVELLQKLSAKIDHAVDTIVLLRLQIEELEAQKLNLQQENLALANKHAAWEHSLNMMLGKLEEADALHPA